jgi:indolepyruvate ferredoxin oxidoreductase beta subunit
MKSCILTGVGGQGTILAAKLIAQTAMDKGLKVRTAETIGMAQRGGSVLSHVRVGREIHSPLIPLGTADAIIAFELAEAARALPYLKPGGHMVAAQKSIIPFTTSLMGAEYDTRQILSFLESQVGQLTLLDTGAIAQACGTEKVINVALLGAAAALGVLDFTLEEMENTLNHVLPEKIRPMNLKALHLGAQAAHSRMGL